MPGSKTRYRSQAGIIYDILRTVENLGRAPPTRIMYGANLPFDRAKKLVSSLEQKGLLRLVEEDNKRFYELTPKGYEALKELERTKRLLEQLGMRF